MRTSWAASTRKQWGTVLELSTRIAEEVYFHALSTSCDLAEQNGPHPNFAHTRAARGELGRTQHWLPERRRGPDGAGRTSYRRTGDASPLG